MVFRKRNKANSSIICQEHYGALRGREKKRSDGHNEDSGRSNCESNRL
jgi:hypothetical protein